MDAEDSSLVSFREDGDSEDSDTPNDRVAWRELDVDKLVHGSLEQVRAELKAKLGKDAEIPQDIIDEAKKQETELLNQLKKDLPAAGCTHMGYSFLAGAALNSLSFFIANGINKTLLAAGVSAVNAAGITPLAGILHKLFELLAARCRVGTVASEDARVYGEQNKHLAKAVRVGIRNALRCCICQEPIVNTARQKYDFGTAFKAYRRKFWTDDFAVTSFIVAYSAENLATFLWGTPAYWQIATKVGAGLVGGAASGVWSQWTRAMMYADQDGAYTFNPSHHRIRGTDEGRKWVTSKQLSTTLQIAKCEQLVAKKGTPPEKVKECTEDLRKLRESRERHAQAFQWCGGNPYKESFAKACCTVGGWAQMAGRAAMLLPLTGSLMALGMYSTHAVARILVPPYAFIVLGFMFKDEITLLFRLLFACFMGVGDFLALDFCAADEDDDDESIAMRDVVVQVPKLTSNANDSASRSDALVSMSDESSSNTHVNDDEAHSDTLVSSSDDPSEDSGHDQ